MIVGMMMFGLHLRAMRVAYEIWPAAVADFAARIMLRQG